MREADADAAGDDGKKRWGREMGGEVGEEAADGGGGGRGGEGEEGADEGEGKGGGRDGTGDPGGGGFCAATEACGGRGGGGEVVRERREFEDTGPEEVAEGSAEEGEGKTDKGGCRDGK